MHKQRRMPCEERGRNDVSIDWRTQRTVSNQQKLGQSWNRPFPRVFIRSIALMRPWFNRLLVVGLWKNNLYCFNRNNIQGKKLGKALGNEYSIFWCADWPIVCLLWSKYSNLLPIFPLNCLSPCYWVVYTIHMHLIHTYRMPGIKLVSQIIILLGFFVLHTNTHILDTTIYMAYILRIFSPNLWIGFYFLKSVFKAKDFNCGELKFACFSFYVFLFYFILFLNFTILY